MNGPPGANERRPHGETGAQESTATTTESKVTRSFDIETPAALRRRREASYRKPILSSGYHDPLDELARNWPRDPDASRAAWHHLNDLGLMSDVVERVLVELAGAA